MQLLPVSETGDFENASLRLRMEQTTRSSISRHFCAMSGDQEVGLIVLDLTPDVEDATLYELFVRLDLRGKGIGSAVLKAVEEYVRSIGRRRVILYPRPLEVEGTPSDLRGWYLRRGYAQYAESPDLLVKAVV